MVVRLHPRLIQFMLRERPLIKKVKREFFLYRKPCLPEAKEGDWFFDQKFDSYDDAWNQAYENSRQGSWKTWKIEEVFTFETEQNIV